MHPIIDFIVTLPGALFTALYLGLVSLANVIMPQRKSLKNDVALVTGGGSGIGRLVAHRLAKKGATVVLWDLNLAGCEQVVKEIEEDGGKAYAYKCDVTDREAVYALAKKVESDVGTHVTILINNAGIVTGKKFLDCPDGMIQKTFEVNTISHFWTCKAFLPKIIENDHGHLVTIASTAGTMGVSGLSDYCASKFGALGFAESMRFEFKKLGLKNVYSTTVCPFYINTGMFDGVRSRFPFLLPILEPDFVADKIVDAIRTNQEILITPKFCWTGYLMRAFLPVTVFDHLAQALGISESMDDFKGRGSTVGNLSGNSAAGSRDGKKKN